jgi:hypothetical protein
MINLAQSRSSEHAQILAQFMKEAQQCWDIPTIIIGQVLRSQRQRRFTDAALRICQWKS